MGSGIRGLRLELGLGKAPVGHKQHSAPNKTHVERVPRPRAEHTSWVMIAAFSGLSPFVMVPGPARGLVSSRLSSPNL